MKRFTVRTLLALIAILAIWLAFVSNRAQSQKNAIVELSTIGVSVHYDYQHAALSTRELALSGSAWGPIVVPNQPEMTTAAPKWLRSFMGDDYFCSVTATTIPVGTQHKLKAILPLLRKLPRLEEVLLINNGVSESDYNQLLEDLSKALPLMKITDAMEDTMLL